MTAFFDFLLLLDVLREVQSEFVSNVDAKAVARAAQSNGIIPQWVKNEILGAKANDEANYVLLEHLCSQATLRDLRELCRIMKATKGCSKMIDFGKKLQTGLEKVMIIVCIICDVMHVVSKTIWNTAHEYYTRVHNLHIHVHEELKWVYELFV